MIDGMHGLGDNFYQRAVLKQYRPDRPVHLVTSWPQLYADLEHVRPVRPRGVRLRTQAKNSGRRDLRWAPDPVRPDRIRWHYVHRAGSIAESLLAALGLPAAPVDMAGLPVEPIEGPRPYVLIRPATVRREWAAGSRNPRPQYLAYAAEAARRAGFRVVSVADLAHREEWALDPLPRADTVFHAGELPVESLLRYVAGAAAVIGGVGWLVPAALAYRRKMLLIYGGWGAHNGPDRIFGPLVDASNVTQLLPDRFCMCTSSEHDCDKEITAAEERIDEFFACLARG